jgi:hypothetical protein
MFQVDVITCLKYPTKKGKNTLRKSSKLSIQVVCDSQNIL